MVTEGAEINVGRFSLYVEIVRSVNIACVY